MPSHHLCTSIVPFCFSCLAAFDKMSGAASWNKSPSRLGRLDQYLDRVVQIIYFYFNRYSSLLTSSVGSTPSALHKSRTSINEIFRSPCSTFAMYDWGTRSLFATSICLNPALTRAAFSSCLSNSFFALCGTMPVSSILFQNIPFQDMLSQSHALRMLRSKDEGHKSKFTRCN